MELDNIEKLIEKYFEAATTVAEEETLKEYFSQESVAPHLEQYAPMFQYFASAKKERFTKQVPLTSEVTKVKKNRYGWYSAAAAVAICAGLYFNQPTAIEDEYSPEEIAAAQEALALLGDNFNKGTHQFSHLNEFEKNTTRFIQKN
ncbi:hypothetical protein JQC67_15570 [Aurantibacter crassamenti]|uniref:hypothetical protein n=1 Tax=Aurantibacter crassamenti TaxID=1837375 RepID=UPI00193A78E4|nr:hypothetical protein [Aurantibacter crassamenti]MBM1107574.1 hypothetical protein [Aurantibacter crassamenti]